MSHPSRSSSRARLARRASFLKAATLVVSASVVAGLPTAAFSQAVANAKLHGTVTDTTGSVIPDATVVATQTETGASVTATTNSAGSYTLPNLPVGPYTLKVSAPGFKGYTQSGIVLQVSSDPEVDASLPVGGSEENVTVVASAAQVQTADNAISTVIDQRRTVDLPLNGRNAASLVLLSGGTVPTGNGNMTSSKNYGSTGTNSIGGALNTSVAGGQGNQINYLLDGGDHNDTFSNVNMPFPFPDALQEFSVQTTGLQAQYGVHPAATVSIVTKSGSNQWHGGVFEFLRNSYANAHDRLSGGLTDLKRNQFGGYLGGPVLHDKLFFFGGYQHTALRITPSATTANIPTAAMISGNWTPYFQLLRSRNNGTCTFSAAKLLAAGFSAADQTACTATASPSNYSPAALKLMSYLPTSTTQDATGLVNYRVPAPQDENQWIGRVDYSALSKHTIFARYFMTNYYQKALFNGNLLLAANAGLKDRGKYLTLGDNYTITPNMVNALRVTGSRLAIARGSAGDLINPNTLGINIYNSLPNSIYLNVTGGFTAACGTCSPTHFVTNHIQAADDLSYSKGNHFIQVGFDYIHEQLNLAGLNIANGQFFFTGNTSGFGLADLMLGAPSTFTQGYGPGATEHLRQNYFGYYAQDTWHATQRLTINAGLRWEPWLPAYEKNNVGASFNMDNFTSNTVSSVYTNAPAGLTYYGDKGVKRGFTNTRLANFSPRFGLAFDPTGAGKQSIRASYTLTFESPELYYYSGFSGVAPYATSTSVTLDNSTNATDTTKSFDNPWKKVTGGNPFPITYPPTANATFPAANISASSYPRNLSRTYLHMYNASYQIQATQDLLLSASYVGTSTQHLWGFLPINYATPAATPTGAAATTNNTAQRYILYRQAIAAGTTAGTRYSSFNGLSSYGMANYNGVILTANKRLSQSFSVLANYTYSHCLSNINYTGDNAPTPQSATDTRSEYGNCNFDITHNMTISGVFLTPKFKGKLVNQIAGGWQVSPLISLRSGSPYNITLGSDNSLTGIGQDRPNVVQGVSTYAKDLYPTRASATSSIQPVWFNKAALALAPTGTFGNYRPFSQRGPGYKNVDVSISKRFSLYERTMLELRGEAFNALNHPNYSNPISTGFTSSTFGRITSMANEARLLQIAAKITF